MGLLAHIICCNDTMKHVVVDDFAVAEETLLKVALADYRAKRPYYKSREEYHNTMYWHIHTVECSGKGVKLNGNLQHHVPHR